MKKVSRCCQAEIYRDNDPATDENHIWDCCSHCSRPCEVMEFGVDMAKAGGDKTGITQKIVWGIPQFMSMTCDQLSMKLKEHGFNLDEPITMQWDEMDVNFTQIKEYQIVM